MSVGMWVLLAVVVIASITIITQGRKRKWYDVYTANNDVIRVYRKMSDWWLRDSGEMMGYRKEVMDDATKSVKSIRTWIPRHWIIKIEEVSDGKN